MLKLRPWDAENHIVYCDWFKRFIQKNRTNQLNNNIFSEKAWFYLNGYNSQNTPIWGGIHSHILYEILFTQQ